MMLWGMLAVYLVIGVTIAIPMHLESHRYYANRQHSLRARVIIILYIACALYWLPLLIRAMFEKDKRV
jgi:hypothetical protein